MSEHWNKAEEVRLKRQRDVLREVMESAAVCGVWMTLGEIAERTGYPPASVSAQLRHLRNGTGGYIGPRYEVKKRQRRPGLGLWEYQARKAETQLTKRVEKLPRGRVKVAFEIKQLNLELKGKA